MDLSVWGAVPRVSIKDARTTQASASTKFKISHKKISCTIYS